ncbi:cytochrome c oxidase subunit NDUFA4-like [Xenia sp. Carnegie-2017]|uniref:cytochrome c oxidase subunit NDUFA4-like n=1 Tax=Xenia sp. Carnegie-2017 TaxID=2897299 RepID=UPI001F045682|nr:cytochrome c oxidase subunit NDUFA4-like [Xenia sp. Carnegie-2017]
MLIHTRLKHPEVSAKMLSILKKNKELYPVTACVVFGCFLSVGYLFRMAFQHPDAAWYNKRENLPWNTVAHNQKKKFYSTFDYSKLKDERPKYE